MRPCRPGLVVLSALAFAASAPDVVFTQAQPSTSADILLYRVTIDDPMTFTRAWTVELPARMSSGPIYEYACHEANYGLEGILRGHRAEEKAAAEAMKTRQ